MIEMFQTKTEIDEIKNIRSPQLLLDAFSMHAGLAGAVVCPRQAQRAVGVGGTNTVEPVHLVHAGPSAHTRV